MAEFRLSFNPAGSTSGTLDPAYPSLSLAGALCPGLAFSQAEVAGAQPAFAASRMHFVIGQPYTLGWRCVFRFGERLIGRAPESINHWELSKSLLLAQG